MGSSQFRVNAFFANTPGGHNDELKVDGPRRADLIVRFARDAEADLIFMNEFHRILAQGWKDAIPSPHGRYPLLQAPYNLKAPNGNAFASNRQTINVLDFHPFNYEQYNLYAVLLQHRSSASKFGGVGYHIPASRGDYSRTPYFKRQMELRCKGVQDAIVEELGIPVIGGGDRNSANPSPYGDGYDKRRVDVQWGMVRKGSIVYAKSITAAAGVITDHKGALKMRVTMAVNKSKVQSLDRIF